MLLLTGQDLLEPMWILVKISEADWSMLKRLLLLRYMYKARFFLLVDLREIFSGLGSGGRKKNK